MSGPRSGLVEQEWGSDPLVSGQELQACHRCGGCCGPRLAFITSWREVVSFPSVFMKVLALSSALSVAIDDHWFPFTCQAVSLTGFHMWSPLHSRSRARLAVALSLSPAAALGLRVSC